MDQNTRQQLTELINRPELNNKICADCASLGPQWVSLSHAIFICLSCAGIHRGFGVHISFVRSIAMDAFSEDQLRRMKLGGNAPFIDFLQSYSPAEAGGYSAGMSTYDKYHSWAASQYREKLTAALEDREWSPSLPPKPPALQASTSISDSATSLRKSRTTAGRSGPGPSASDVALTTDRITGFDQKTANEAYFSSLGAINANRSAELPPSQGGRYAGFGSTPSPASGSDSSHPSFGLSSAALPSSFSDIREDPVGAINKGWSLFSSAVIGASRAVHENVIQPGVEKVSDPNFRSGVTQYVTNTTKTANDWGRAQLGVDVGGFVSNLTNNNARGSYATVSSHADQHDNDEEEHSSALYADARDDDFFAEFNNQSRPTSTKHYSPPTVTGKSAPKKDEWQDDEWKDF